MMEFRYVLAGMDQPLVVVEDEVNEFQMALHSEIYRYQDATGYRPTHLLLGRRQQALWAAMIYFAQQRGRLHVDPKINAKEHRFCGLLILNKSDMTDCIMAAEQRK